MHRIPFPAVILIMAILSCGCAGNPQSPGITFPARGSDTAYLSFLETFSVPLNLSYNPVILPDSDMASENRKRAGETLAILAASRQSLSELRVPAAFESSRASQMSSLDELKAMADFMQTPVYAGKVYGDMTADERNLADAYSIHVQNYGVLQPAIYDDPVCSAAAQGGYRNITRLCRLFHESQTETSATGP